MKLTRNIIAIAGAVILIPVVWAAGWYFIPKSSAEVEKGRYQKVLACEKLADDVVVSYEQFRDDKETLRLAEETLKNPPSDFEKLTATAYLYAMREAGSSKDARATAWAMCMDFYDEK